MKLLSHECEKSVREASPSQLHATACEYKCTQVQTISEQSVLNIDDGSHNRVLTLTLLDEHWEDESKREQRIADKLAKRPRYRIN